MGRRARWVAVSILLLSTLFVHSCEELRVGTSNLDRDLRSLIAQHELTGDPSAGRDLPKISDPLAQLGMQLFFSKALSGDKDIACATCHYPSLGGGDALALSIGEGADSPDLLGPGRTRLHDTTGPAYEEEESFRGPTVGRHSPTTFNVGLWDQVLFFDGRVESLGKSPGVNGGDGLGISTPDSYRSVADPNAGDNLVQAQSRFPVTSREEMQGYGFGQNRSRDSVRALLAARIGDYGPGEGDLSPNGWLPEFQAAFQSSEDAETLINFENIVKAIGEYERSQIFVNTPWKAYVQGDDDAIGDAAKRGAVLFFSTIEEDGANCASCHSGDFFTDEQFYVLAVPQVGLGKDDGPAEDDDFGRFRVTGNPDDRYAFRTSALLNVEATGPYGHDGAYATLEGIVRHHLSPSAALEPVHFGNYDYSQLDPSVQTVNTNSNTRRALAQLEKNRLAGIPSIEDVTLAVDEVEDIIEFLRALTDPCVVDRACLAPWIPEDDDPDPDSLRLRGVDSDGGSL